MAINVYKHVDAASSGGGDGTTWATSGANAAYTEAELESFLEGTVVAGDVIFIKEGTYTLDSAWDSSARDGSATAPIAIIGVLSGTTNTGASVVYTDWATGANRPFIDAGANAITFGDHYLLSNLNFQGNASTLVTTGTYHRSFNCKYDQDNGSSAAQWCINVGSGHLIYCEFTAANCRGVYCAGSITIAFCYLHDIGNGTAISLNANAAIIVNNALDTCNIGITVASNRLCYIANNTLYECATSISGTTGYSNVCINNIIEGANTDGIIWTTQTDSNFFWKNHGDDARNNDMWDGIDVTTVFKDYEVTTGDPSFTNAASGNFNLGAASPCLNVGLNPMGQ